LTPPNSASPSKLRLPCLMCGFLFIEPWPL
jgi:hypothetical protein